jgi:hypothetical protein
MLEEKESKDLVERTLDNSNGRTLGKYTISTIFESVGSVRGRFFVVKLDCIDYSQDQPSMYAIWTNIFEDHTLNSRLATGRDTFTTLTDALSAFEKLVDKYHLQLQRKTGASP